jgi:hypothetical protein
VDPSSRHRAASINWTLVSWVMSLVMEKTKSKIARGWSLGHFVIPCTPAPRGETFTFRRSTRYLPAAFPCFAFGVNSQLSALR